LKDLLDQELHQGNYKTNQINEKEKEKESTNINHTLFISDLQNTLDERCSKNQELERELGNNVEEIKR